MHKLRLDLNIHQYPALNGLRMHATDKLNPGSVPFIIGTAIRVFDLRSLCFAEAAVKGGYLGRYSKLSFWLSGSFLDADGNWKYVTFQLFSKGKDGRLISAVPIDVAICIQKTAV